MSLLKTNNIEALQLVACEALFLILEIGSLRKFSDEIEACDDIAKLVRSTVCSINPTFIKYSEVTILHYAELDLGLEFDLKFLISGQIPKEEYSSRQTKSNLIDMVRVNTGTIAAL